jgi:hypothetical protein
MLDLLKLWTVAFAVLAAVALLAGALGQADENMKRCSVARCT